MPVALEPGVETIELAREPLEIRDDVLDLQKHRPGHAQVARAMLADDRFILDGLGAERAFHRGYLNLARLRIIAISLSALRISSAIISRLRNSSSRSATSEAGMAISREHAVQTRASSALSEWQNGHFIGAIRA